MPNPPASMMADDLRELLPPTARAWAYLLDYREPGAEITPLEQLEIAELIDRGLSPADAAEIVQARTTTRKP